MEAEKKQDTIIWYCESKGYGFIKVDHSLDFFCHATSLEEGYTPSTGDVVLFQPSTRKGRPFATEVKKI